MLTSGRSLRAHALLLLAALIWGFSFVAQVAGGAVVDAFTFNGTRFALGAVSLLPIIAFLDARARRPRSERLAAWSCAVFPGMIAGLALFVAAWLQQKGMESTTAGHGGFITGLYMVLVPLLGIALGHRTRWTTWIGIVLAVVGLYLLSIRGGFMMATGDVWVLVGTLFWAVHILLIDRFSSQPDPLRLSVIQFLACASYNLVCAPAFDAHPFQGLGQAVIPVLYGGLMSVGVAYTLQVVGQRDAVPSIAAMLLSLESLFAAVGGALLLGETMSLRGYLGCALMMAGILLSQASGDGSADPAPEPVPTAADEVTASRQRLWPRRLRWWSDMWAGGYACTTRRRPVQRGKDGATHRGDSGGFGEGTGLRRPSDEAG